LRSRGKRTVVLVASLVVVLYAAVSCHMAVTLTRADRIPVENSPASYDLVYEEVEFTPRHATIKLRGWHIDGGREGPDIILVHGVDVNRESDRALELSAQLVRAGFDVLLFDLRAHGRSDGELVSGGYHERQDLLGAIDFLRQRGGADGRIGVLGNSLGGAVALLAAATEPDIAAVVADSPFASLLEMIPPEAARETGLPTWLAGIFLPGVRMVSRLYYGIELTSLVPEEAAAGIEVPVFLIHGTGDTRVPPEHSRRIYARCTHAGSSLWLPPDVEHVKSFETYPGAYVRRVCDFFARHLYAEP